MWPQLWREQNGSKHVQLTSCVVRNTSSFLLFMHSFTFKQYFFIPLPRMCTHMDTFLWLPFSHTLQGLWNRRVFFVSNLAVCSTASPLTTVDRSCTSFCLNWLFLSCLLLLVGNANDWHLNLKEPGFDWLLQGVTEIRALKCGWVYVCELLVGHSINPPVFL